jgi:hypothetical protein
MEWLNEPAAWSAEGDTINVTAEAQTDFWRITHDNGERDSGHFYYQTVSGDFVAEVKFSADYRDLYDQAGLMVRADARHWVKCGIELFNGLQHASVVVTREASDWSIIPLDDPPVAVWLRVNRHEHTVTVEFSPDGAHYTMLRQAFLTRAESVQVGVMVCAPTGEGFTARFEGFAVHAG